MSIDFPAKVEFCLNNAVDGTTGQNARDPISLGETNDGWVPFGRKPPRQSQNQLFFEHGNWTTYLKEVFEPFQNSINNMLLSSKNGLSIPFTGFFSDGTTQLQQGAVFEAVMNKVVLSSVTAETKFFSSAVGGGLFDKDASTVWADNRTGGMYSTAPVDDTWIFIFAIGKEDGTVELASDNRADAINVITNIMGTGVNDYQYIRMLLATPWVNSGGGGRFPEFRYQANDFIAYGAEVSEAAQVFNETGTAFVLRNLSLPMSGITVMPATVTPDAVSVIGVSRNAPTRLLIRVPTGTVEYGVTQGDADIPGSYTSTGSTITRVGEGMIDNFYITSSSADSSRIRVAAGGAGNTEIQISVLGYTNPCTFRNMIWQF